MRLHFTSNHQNVVPLLITREAFSERSQKPGKFLIIQFSIHFLFFSTISAPIYVMSDTSSETFTVSSKTFTDLKTRPAYQELRLAATIHKLNAKFYRARCTLNTFRTPKSTHPDHHTSKKKVYCE